MNAIQAYMCVQGRKGTSMISNLMPILTCLVQSSLIYSVCIKMNPIAINKDRYSPIYS